MIHSREDLLRELESWNKGDTPFRMKYVEIMANKYMNWFDKNIKIEVHKDSNLKGINANVSVYMPKSKIRVIGVSQQLLDWVLDECKIRYLYRLIGHEVAHIYYDDSAVFTGIHLQMKGLKFIEDLPDDEKSNCMRVLHALKESRADILGIQLARGSFPILYQSKEDIEYGFITDSMKPSAAMCYKAGYLLPEDRAQLGIKFSHCLGCDRYIAQEVLFQLLSKYNVDKYVFWEFLVTKMQRAKLPTTKSYYTTWCKLLR